VFINEHHFQLQTHFAERMFLSERMTAFYECDHLTRLYLNFLNVNVIYKPVNYYSMWIMGRRKSTSRPHKSRRTVEGRCPKCTTIVRFNVSGPVGNEIYECIGCRSKFPIDEL